MPPWKPQQGIQHYQKENYLSDDEIGLITQWVDAGMPRGNAAEEPELPVFPEGSQVGTQTLLYLSLNHICTKALGSMNTDIL